MRKALIIVGLLVSLAAQPQEIYRWVDKDGVVHYADQPGSPDAVLIPNPAAGYTAPDDGEPPRLYQSEPSGTSPSSEPTYQSLRITSPAPDEVFYGADVTVSVQLALDRDLRPGDSASIVLDGQPVPDAAGLSATLTGLTRGTHYLRAAVKDESGSTIITSPQIAFHLRQATVATPPTGPALRPPVRPRPTPRSGN